MEGEWRGGGLHESKIGQSRLRVSGVVLNTCIIEKERHGNFRQTPPELLF